MKITRLLIHIVTALALSAGSVSAQYAGWQRAGSFYILTTPEGANLPEASREEDFPLLVRLHKDWFDFGKRTMANEFRIKEHASSSLISIA